MMEETDIRQNQPETAETSCDRQEAEESRMGALVRMDYRRRHTSQPDVDEAWEAFRREKMVVRETPKRGFSAWHLTAAALLGAAAMLALVFLFRHAFLGESTQQQSKEIVAMQYDEKPQRVKLERGEDTLDLTQKDSISYQEAAKPQKPAIVARAQNKTQRLSTPRGMDFKVVLPDGSEVVLNAESTIEFPTAFQSGKRMVKLKGEAYFKVVRNDDAPFIVTSDQLSVRVLGTEFNMKSYASEVAHVALVKGKVEVMRPDATVCDATLNPGQEAWYNAKGEVQVQEVDTYAVFDTEPTMCDDVLDIETQDTAITVTNKSGSDITGPIYVYYKIAYGDLYLGGITYRVGISSGLKAGESSTCYAGHFSNDYSALMFATYVQ